MGKYLAVTLLFIIFSFVDLSAQAKSHNDMLYLDSDKSHKSKDYKIDKVKVPVKQKIQNAKAQSSLSRYQKKKAKAEKKLEASKEKLEAQTSKQNAKLSLFTIKQYVRLKSSFSGHKSNPASKW